MSSVGGLTYTQAAEAAVKYGPNVIAQRAGRGRIAIFLDQFRNALVVLLVGAGAAAVVTGDVVDGVLIGAIVLVNAVLGWAQEYKAEDAIRKLRSLGGGKVRVRRSEREMEIDVKEVVPGDMVHLEEGTRMPADGKVVESVSLEVDEAVLTGESMPVVKQAGDGGKAHVNSVFSGTMVAGGTGWMEVTATGGQTRFGGLARKLAAIAPEPTPLEKKLSGLAKWMVGAGVVACAVVVGTLAGEPEGWLPAWSAGVAVAVAVIPEGLPAVLSVTLAVGVMRMAREKAVVRRLVAVEALGGTTVVATDKTGTLTKNEMEVKEVVVGDELWKVGEESPDISHKEYAQMLLCGVLASTAVLVVKENHGDYEVIGDRTEGALLKLAQSAGLVPDLVRQKNIRIWEYPFDSRLRLMSVVVDPEPAGGEMTLYTKGAPEEVWKRTNISKLRAQKLRRMYEGMAGRGLRVLGLAYKRWKGTRKREEAEKGLVWLGMVGVADPLRPESAGVLAAAREAGVRVVMITGDSELTAAQIAREAGLIKVNEEVMTGQELDEITDEALDGVVGRVRIFARIAPEQKLRIVKALQKQGEIVLMTGDGVNDALAIEQADVGVAMGKTGTDVARETADLVLLDDNLKTILRAIESGRVIVANIARTVRYLLAGNLGEMLTILTAVVAWRVIPLLPVQILWVNLVSDSLPALALAVGDGDRGLMKGKTAGFSKWVVGRGDWLFLTAAAGLVAVLSLAAFGVWGRAGAFTALVTAQMGVAFAVGGRRMNRALVGAVVLVLALQGLILTVPVLRGIFRI